MQVYPARTADISLSTGLGTISVSGVAPDVGLRTFADVMQLGDTIYLGVAHRELDEWEEGIYTYIGTGRLARTTILQSSNSGAAVDFSAGIKDVWCTVPLRTVQYADQSVTHTGQTIIDFGTSSAATSTVVPAQSIQANSIVLTQVMAVATADHTVADHYTAMPLVIGGEIVVGTSFTIRAISRSGNLTGTYTVAWAWK